MIVWENGDMLINGTDEYSNTANGFAIFTTYIMNVFGIAAIIFLLTTKKFTDQNAPQRITFALMVVNFFIAVDLQIQAMFWYLKLSATSALAVGLVIKFLEVMLLNWSDLLVLGTFVHYCVLIKRTNLLQADSDSNVYRLTNYYIIGTGVFSVIPATVAIALSETAKNESIYVMITAASITKSSAIYFAFQGTCLVVAVIVAVALLYLTCTKQIKTSNGLKSDVRKSLRLLLLLSLTYLLLNVGKVIFQVPYHLGLWPTLDFDIYILWNYVAMMQYILQSVLAIYFSRKTVDPWEYHLTIDADNDQHDLDQLGDHQTHATHGRPQSVRINEFGL